MARVRFYIDEDAMRAAFIRALRQAGLDVTTVAEANQLGRTDAEQLAWAAAQGRVLYTFNVKDFSLLHRQWLMQEKSHAGIVAAPRQQYAIGEQRQGLIALAQSLPAEAMVNQLVYLGRFLS